MMCNVLQKRQQLKELSAKLAIVQQEVYEIESKNPEFVKRIQELEESKKKITTELETPILVTFENFAEITYLWEGVGEWPRIIDWKFVFDKEINDVLEFLFIKEKQIALLFETKHKKIKAMLQTLAELDDRVIAHNEKVKIIFEESKDETVLILNINNSID